jgi:hypothetical protein
MSLLLSSTTTSRDVVHVFDIAASPKAETAFLHNDPSYIWGQASRTPPCNIRGHYTERKSLPLEAEMVKTMQSGTQLRRRRLVVCAPFGRSYCSTYIRMQILAHPLQNACRRRDADAGGQDDEDAEDCR